MSYLEHESFKSAASPQIIVGNRNYLEGNLNIKYELNKLQESIHYIKAHDTIRMM